MPSTSFGISNRSIEEKDLIGEYGELYYKSSLHLKQRHTNSFILKMCSSNRWQFTKKVKLFDWARQERDFSRHSYLSFAPAEEVKNEMKYFKQQNINTRLAEIKTEFRVY